MAGGLQNPESWETLTAPINSCPCWRKVQTTYDAVQRYIEVMKQFEVATNPRYVVNHQGKGETYCNIFVWDVTKAMGCEIPHWYSRELDANALVRWLMTEGVVEHGWHRVIPSEAIKEANLGHPVVVTFLNPKGIGHVAMLMPSEKVELRVSQAGGHNFFDGLLASGFGKYPVEFYAHD